MPFTYAPQGPWWNPHLPEGVYDARIDMVNEKFCCEGRKTYIQVAFWLPKEEVCVVTNFYFSEDRPEEKTLKRLAMLCRCVGMVPQEIRENPRAFRGLELQISIKRIQNDEVNEGFEYCDVELFLPAGSVEIKQQV